MAQQTDIQRHSPRHEPPHSLDAEQALLGCCLKAETALSNAIEQLDSEQFFYYPKHQLIYRAMLDLYHESEPCDITTISVRLETKKELERIGGRLYLVELAETVATASNIVSYANIVLEKYTLRRLSETASEIESSCLSGDVEAGELLDQAEADVFRLSQYRMKRGFQSIGSLVNPLVEQMEEYGRTGGGVGLQTGFTELDRLTNGFQNGDLIVLAARPSMGKTAIALNITDYVANHLNKNGGAVGIFSIEMSAEALTLRMLSSRARISQQRMRSGKLSAEEWQRVAVTAGNLSESRLFIDDSAALSPLELRAKARRLKSSHDVSMIVVDYIQLMHSTGRVENRQQEIALISRGLKSLAKELEIPVIAVSQLSRMVEQRGGDKRPQLSDLRESGAIEQDADVVIMLYRPEYYLNPDERDDPQNFDKINLAEAIVAKQRNGPTGTAKLTFLKEYAKFENRDVADRELPPEAQPIDDGDAPF